MRETGRMVIAEELHYQAILARMVRDATVLEGLAAEAVGYLSSGLRGLPARTELDAVTGLDLAGAAVFRAGLLARTEETGFRISDDALTVLRAYGDVPAELEIPQGILSVPVERTRYPFSAYSLSVWHGSGRPLHDLTLSAPQHRHILEPA
jgi:hypothetical protein